MGGNSPPPGVGKLSGNVSGFGMRSVQSVMFGPSVRLYLPSRFWAGNDRRYWLWKRRSLKVRPAPRSVTVTVDGSMGPSGPTNVRMSALVNVRGSTGSLNVTRTLAKLIGFFSRFNVQLTNRPVLSVELVVISSVQTPAE